MVFPPSVVSKAKSSFSEMARRSSRRPLHTHEKGIEFSAQSVDPGFRSVGESCVLIHGNQDCFGCVMLCDYDDGTLHGPFQQAPKFILRLSGSNRSSALVYRRHGYI